MTRIDPEIKEVHLTLPVRPEDLSGLDLGTVVYLSGVIYTAREKVYKKILEEGVDFPEEVRAISNVNFHCSPAAGPDGSGGYRIGAVTATASFRFSKYIEDWIDKSGCGLFLGKGGMRAEDYTNVLAPRGVIYMSTVGYGTGALLGKSIKKIRDVYWLEELGYAQAMWVLEVENFGPFLVESNSKGESLFELQNERINKNIEKIYEDLKTPALFRFGETTDRKDEVM